MQLPARRLPSMRKLHSTIRLLLSPKLAYDSWNGELMFASIFKELDHLAFGLAERMYMENIIACYNSRLQSEFFDRTHVYLFSNSYSADDQIGKLFDCHDDAGEIVKR